MRFIGPLRVILIAGNLLVACVHAPPKFTYKNLDQPNELAPQSGEHQLTAEEVSSDIGLLLYALDRGYAGKEFVPRKDWARLTQRLVSLKGRSLKVSDFCNQIGDALWQVPDAHLGARRVESSHDNSTRCGQLFKIKQRQSSVGNNYSHSEKNRNWTTEVISNGRATVGVVTIKWFPDHGDPAWAGYDRALSELTKNDAIIIDMRGNGGGDDTRGYQLAKTLIDGEVWGGSGIAVHFRETPETLTLLMNTLAMVGRQKDGTLGDFMMDPYAKTTAQRDEAALGKKPEYRVENLPPPRVVLGPRAFRGPIAILVDEECGSSCESSLVVLRQHPSAKVFGARTGGYVHFGNVGALILPLSHIFVGIPTKYNEFPDGKFYDKVGFEPDVAVPAGQDAFDVSSKWISEALPSKESPLVAPGMTRGLSEESITELKTARQAFIDIEAICQKDAGKLWGSTLCGPVMLVNPTSRAMYTNVRPQDFTGRIKDGVFVTTLPAAENVAETAVEWQGTLWAQLALPLPDDSQERLAVLFHESFHRLQVAERWPSVQDQRVNTHLASLDGRYLMQLEWRALGEALGAEGEAKRRAIQDALFFRLARRTAFSKAGKEERALEWKEGLAEYTGIKLASDDAGQRHAFAKAKLDKAAAWESFVRSFAYASGPAYGLLLDETAPTWRTRAKQGTDLGSLLAAALKLPLEKPTKEALELRAQKYDGVALRISEQTRESNAKKRVAELKMKLVTGPVLKLPLSKAALQFEPSNLVSLQELGTVYPTARIVDEWGVLSVKQDVLLDSQWKFASVSAPTEVSGPVLHGQDWTLELNPGWSISKAQRPGDFRIGK